LQKVAADHDKDFLKTQASKWLTKNLCHCQHLKTLKVFLGGAGRRGRNHCGSAKEQWKKIKIKDPGFAAHPGQLFKSFISRPKQLGAINISLTVWCS
jgi:hypothetical protein